MDRHQLKHEILTLAAGAGYELARVAPVEIPETDRQNLLDFLEQGRHASMGYMGNHTRIRLNPGQIMEDARSVIVLGSLYRNGFYNEKVDELPVKISRYAVGKDYHKVLRKKGKQLLASIKEIHPGVEGRITVDSAPVPEKILGRIAGLGWQGRHTNLIHPEYGSYFFISTIFLNVELETDKSIPNLCGSCRLCIENCPTKALDDTGMDANRCISYWNIETEETPPEVIADNLKGWIFGCDICQEVCPYNRRRRALKHETGMMEFQPRTELIDVLEKGVEPDSLTYDRLVQSSPLKRVSRDKLNRMIGLVRKNQDGNQHGIPK